MRTSSPNRLGPRALLGLVTLLPFGWHSANGQCRAGAGPAQPFGPSTTVADSGRLYSYTLTADGHELYFFKRMTSDGEDYRIFRSRRVGPTWEVPERVDLGGDYSDLYPAISRDGIWLVFASYRPAPHDTSTKPNAHLWLARRQGDGWGHPEFVAASRLGYYHSGLKLDSAGTLRYRETTPDWRASRDLELRWRDGVFAAVSREVPFQAAADYWRRRSGDSGYVWGALAGPGGLALVQRSAIIAPNGRRGPAQYFVTYPNAGGWTALMRAGGGLGDGSPNFAWFSADGCFVHFTKDYTHFMRVSVAAVVGAR